MLKIILAAVLLVLCAYIGFAVERFYKSRLKILEEYSAFIRYVERETEFLKTDLVELLTSFECTTELRSAFTSAAALIGAGKPVELECKFLSDGAVAEIRAFLAAMSEADYYGKNAVIKHAGKVADELTAKAGKEKIQKGELIRKLMILLGVGLVVLTL